MIYNQGRKQIVFLRLSFLLLLTFSKVKLYFCNVKSNKKVVLLKKIYAIAKWEFSQRLKDKSFQISLIVIPVIILSINFAFHYFNKPETETTKVIGVIDYTESYFNSINRDFKNIKLKSGLPKYVLVKLSKDTKQDLSGEKLISSVIVIKENRGKTEAEIISKFGLALDEIELIKNQLGNVFLKSEISRKYGINTLSEDIDSYSITSRYAGKDGGKNDEYLSEFFSGFVFVLLFIMLILFSGASFVRSLIVEKTSRLIELLLSSCSPREILFGKLLGISLTGFFQMIVWGLIGLIFLSNNQLVLNLQNDLLIKIVYFVLGYLLYASVFVGLGSIATSETQAQQITSILSLFMLFPIVLSTFILSPVDTLFATVLMYFPLTSAPTMLIKLTITNASYIDIIISIVILALSIAAVIILSSRFLSKELINFEKSKGRTT